MRKTDEEILVALFDLGEKGSPKEILERVESSNSYRYILSRIRELKEQELIGKLNKGEYKLTEEGFEYIKQNNLKEGEIGVLDHIKYYWDQSKLEDLLEKNTFNISSKKSGSQENSLPEIEVVDYVEEGLFSVTLDKNKTKKELENLSKEKDIENYEFLMNIKEELENYNKHND